MYNKLRKQKSQDFKINAITLSVRVLFIKLAVETMKLTYAPKRNPLIEWEGTIRSTHPGKQNIQFIFMKIPFGMYNNNTHIIQRPILLSLWCVRARIHPF